MLKNGASFRFDLDERGTGGPGATCPIPRSSRRSSRARASWFMTARFGCASSECGPFFADCTVLAGGPVSKRKGVNGPEGGAAAGRAVPGNGPGRSGIPSATSRGGLACAEFRCSARPTLTEAPELARAPAPRSCRRFEKPRRRHRLRRGPRGLRRDQGGAWWPGVELPVRTCRDPERLVPQVSHSGQAGDRGNPVAGKHDRKPDVRRGAEVADVATALTKGPTPLMLSAEIGRRLLPGRGRCRTIANKSWRSKVENDGNFRDIMVPRAP